MDLVSLESLTVELLDRARAAAAGRSARTLVGGQDARLRQTVLALTAGTSLGEHESPGEATLVVLTGHVVLTAGDESADATRGDLLAIPRRRHDLRAVEDSTVLLTVAPAPTTA